MLEHYWFNGDLEDASLDENKTDEDMSKKLNQYSFDVSSLKENNMGTDSLQQINLGEMGNSGVGSFYFAAQGGDYSRIVDSHGTFNFNIRVPHDNVANQQT
mmetsp:Transcript_21899/g.18805  ORF Transcript_21899/g.18805 Transcript_21899/m.18805 type:complete len:101 (+) Transcript_21899:401-703(+)